MRIGFFFWKIVLAYLVDLVYTNHIQIIPMIFVQYEAKQIKMAGTGREKEAS